MNRPASAASTYLQETLESAPPIKIVRLLYQGALRFLEQASRADAADPHSRFVYWLTRAEDVVIELRCSLDHQPAPEIAENLEQLYLFVEDRLQQAMQRREPERLEEARSVLVTLLEAWSAVERGEAAAA